MLGCPSDEIAETGGGGAERERRGLLSE